MIHSTLPVQDFPHEPQAVATASFDVSVGLMKQSEEIRSCGVLVMRRQPTKAFLLMVHSHRLDLPKGHVEPGETDLQCALRELREETGIAPEKIEIAADFRHEVTYKVRTRDGLRPKRVVFFLGWLLENVPIEVSEHPDYRWVPWSPPHQIQPETVDGLLHAAENYLEKEDF